MKKSERIITALFLFLFIGFADVSLNAQSMTTTTKDNTTMAAAKPEDVSPLLCGEKIPAAVLMDAKATSFDLNKAVAARPTILVFYRGGWCPYCSKQLSGLQEIVSGLEKTGYQLIAVSTDVPEGLQQTTDKQKLHFTLLSDADLNITKQFGLAYKAPDAYASFLPKTTGGKDVDQLLPVPSVFILDKKGVIQFEYINPDFTHRLNPRLLEAAATALYPEL